MLRPSLRSGLLVLLLLAVSCDGGSDGTVIATLDGEPQHLDALKQYLDANLVAAEEESGPAPEGLDRVKSRLFDAFIVERLLLVEAERREIEVSGLEIEVYLDVGREEWDTAIQESEWQDARRRLMIQKLQESVATNELSIDDDEVAAYVEEHREQLVPHKRLRLRALILESKELADTLYRDIRRRRRTFDEVVVAHAVSPEQGVTLEVSWESLTAEQREALKDLKAGQVSRPVEVAGDTYLFQVESWLKDPAKMEQERLRQARQDLEQRYRQQAHAALVEKLRRKVEITLQPENLPFEYVPE